jgi:hypothetical protein
MDNQPGPAYDTIAPDSMHFAPDDDLNYLAVRAGLLYRVEYRPNP